MMIDNVLNLSAVYCRAKVVPAHGDVMVNTTDSHMYAVWCAVVAHCYTEVVGVSCFPTFVALW